MRKYLTFNNALLSVIILHTASFIYDLIVEKETTHTYSLHLLSIGLLVIIYSNRRLIDSLTELHEYYQMRSELQEQEIETLQQISSLKDGIIEMHRTNHANLKNAVSDFQNDVTDIINGVPSKKRKTP